MDASVDDVSVPQQFVKDNQIVLNISPDAVVDLHITNLIGGARYLADQFIAEDNEFVIDGVLTFDAMASYAFRDLRLDLNLKNLTNREYNQRGVGDSSVTPADPFTVYFGVVYRR